MKRVSAEPRFEDVFPEIRAMRIEITETRLPFGLNAVRVYTTENPPGEHIPCQAHLCCGGGLDLGHLLLRLVRRRTRTLDAVVACKGYKGSPKGHRRYGPCSNSFGLRIVLGFRDG